MSARPDSNGLPGSDVAERLVNGLFFYTLLGCLAGLLISTIVWVFASRAQNFHHAATGRQGTIIAFFGALIAGGRAGVDQLLSEPRRAGPLAN